MDKSFFYSYLQTTQMKNIKYLFNQTWESLIFYKRKGYLHFIGNNILKIGFYYLLIVAAFVLLEKYLLDFDHIFQEIIARFSDVEMIIVFFISESILGPLPPDLFMLWCAKFHYPVLMLLFLGILSYTGGVISYQTGQWISRRKKIKLFIENRLKKYTTLTQKWGGGFITIAALFPFTPYATVILAISLLKYPFNRFLLFGLFRIIRFVIQGIILIELIDLNV